jgi:glutamine phosphoribosylpyrophosphate amidotransferase
MCGVIGVHLENITQSDIYLLYSIFEQTMIRGKHATGVSYVKNKKIHTVKRGEPVTEFFKSFSLSNCVNEDGGIYLIGHIRYSTSDIRYNQPFSNESISIVHNGVISQESVEQWKYKTETSNDSELILKSFENNLHPLEDFPNTSMAVCKITDDKTLIGFRNESRPLWYNVLPKGVIFTSTSDISKRSGLRNPLKCEMYVEYKKSHNKKLESKRYNYDISIQDLQ